MCEIKVELLDSMGNDLSVINSAYASFDKVAEEWNPKTHPRLIRMLARGMTQEEFDAVVANTTASTDDADVKERLIKFRNTPTHFTPFTHNAITLRIKAPISIRTQCFKHKMGFTENEVSRRYVSTTPELFAPTFRAKPKGNVKQGSGGAIDAIHYMVLENLNNPNNREIVVFDTVEDLNAGLEQFKQESRKLLAVGEATQTSIQGKYLEACNTAIKTYEEMIALGVAPEQARFVLPQGVMTEWIWTGNLASYARFYNLRTDPHAQHEISELAEAIGVIIEPLFPHSWKALTKFE